MNRLYIPTSGPCQWRAFLADPNTQWKRNRSAFELAISWESAQQQTSGLPAVVEAILQTNESTRDARLLFAIPEHQVELDNAKAPSQCDLWALLRNSLGHISLAVESKAGEEFGKPIMAWLNQDSKRSGREKRLRWLLRALKLNADENQCGLLRYQLVHRTVAALAEAERFGTFAAVMLVQAFPGAEIAWEDFRAFGRFLGADVEKGRMTRIPSHSKPELYLGWACCPMVSDGDIATAVARTSSPTPK